VKRLEELRGFSEITAPFDGTITARNLDVGQLVNAGGNELLYRIAQTNKLRVFVRIPQSFAHGISVGHATTLTVPELKGRDFEAKIVRTAGAIDPASRTLLAEIEVDNAKGELFAGSYAQVALTAMNENAPLTVPANTVMFRAQGTQVAVVAPDGQHVLLKNVKLGRDFGPRIEILEGVAANDRLVINPADSLVDGMEVRPVDVTDEGIPAGKK
jgi:RND family efflux transporter MFP subunit